MKSGTGMKLYIEANQIRLVRDKADVIVIPASSVTEISYGQDVHRRVGAAIGLAVVTLGLGALMALTKSKKHFVGLTWANGDQKGGFAMQCDKNDYRGVLAVLGGLERKSEERHKPRYDFVRCCVQSTTCCGRSIKRSFRLFARPSAT
jgi:hypothetical protein